MQRSKTRKNEENRKQWCFFSKVEHKHDNPVTSLLVISESIHQQIILQQSVQNTASWALRTFEKKPVISLATINRVGTFALGKTFLI